VLDGTEIIGITLYIKIITSPIRGVIPRIVPNPPNPPNSLLVSLADDVIMLKIFKHWISKKSNLEKSKFINKLLI
jgi:hypothetical protein